MHTKPNGRKAPTAPPHWPFGTTQPQTQKQQRDDLIKRLPAAPF